MDLLGIQFQRVVRELESFLDKSGEFTNATSFLSENFLSVGGTNDNLSILNDWRSYVDLETYLSTGMGDTDVTARVALLGKLSGKEFVQFSTEHTISNEFASLADLGGHFVDICFAREEEG